MKELDTSDPKEHMQNIKSGLRELVEHIRRDIKRVDDPKAETLFETSAEVLDGLIKAYTHFERKNEDAWK